MERIQEPVLLVASAEKLFMTVRGFREQLDTSKLCYQQHGSQLLLFRSGALAYIYQFISEDELLQLISAAKLQKEIRSAPKTVIDVQELLDIL